MITVNQRERFASHTSDGWFVIDTEAEGEHKFGRVVSGPMDGDSAERAAHEMNDRQGDYRYLAAQKF